MKVCLLSMVEIKMFPRMLKIAASLLNRGYRVVAVCFKRHEELQDEEVYKGILIRRTGPLIKIRGRVSQLPILKTLAIIPFLVKALREKADIYHCFHFQALLVGAIIRKFLRIKALLYDGLEDYPFTLSRHYHETLKIPRGLLRHFVLSLELNIIRKFVDFVFTVDSVDGIPYKRYKMVSKNVMIIQNVPELKVDVDEELKRKLIAKYKDYKLVVYVGAIHKIRGCLNMIKAMRYVIEEVPNAKLIMIGPITDADFLREATKIIEQYNLNDNIEFLGIIPYSELHTYLSLCHVGLCSYLYIPVRGTKGSSKLFLYMRAGLPVIASDFPGIKAIIEDAKCGILVDPTNVEEIAKAIIKLLKDPELAKQMGANGRRAIMEKYNWEREESKIMKAYEGMM